MRFFLAAVLALVLGFSARRAEAQVSGNPVITTIAVVGTLGGVATSVGAAVYAIEGRAFDDGWVVGALISSGICGAMTGAIAVEGITSSDGSIAIGIGMLFYAAITIWPAYWVIRTSLSEVDPGDKLEGEYLPEEPVDPFAASRLPQLPATTFSFGGSF